MFALALLASGQSSTITATLAGQIVMEGFLDLRLPAWLRRIVTRLLAIVPAVLVASHYGITSDRKLMGEFVNQRVLKAFAYGISATIIALNLKLLSSLV